MSFKSLAMLVALFVVPALIAVYVSSRRRRSRRAAALAAQAMVATGLGSGGGWRRHAPFALFAAAFAVLAFALARPSMKIRTPRREATVCAAGATSTTTSRKPTRATTPATRTPASTSVPQRPTSPPWTCIRPCRATWALR